VTVPPAADLRECSLYRFYGWDPRTNYTTKTLIYIGETIRAAFDRMMEHIARQSWADTITSWVKDDRPFPDKDAALRAERGAVESEKPLYNAEWNSGNGSRIDLETAKHLRWARDDARGVQRWRPTRAKTMYRRGEQVPAPVGGQSRPYGQMPPGVRPVPAGVAKPQQPSRPGWLIGWATMTLILWAQFYKNDPSSVRDAGISAAILGAVAVGLVARWNSLGRPLGKKDWSRAVAQRYRQREKAKPRRRR
jgi:hypothetical protein